MVSVDRPADLQIALAKASYLADEPTAFATWLALKLGRPLLVEGPAGVGKTDLARATAEALGRTVIRLQCYEGLDEAKALYEWDYGKQILYAQLLRDSSTTREPGKTLTEALDAIDVQPFFGPKFLIARPLLAALMSKTPVVLLIDEVDRADPEFEAFLLELLAEEQITIPEIGTIRAVHPPLTILTTNGTREMTDALRRRCLHAFLDYPPPSRELQILEARVPGIAPALAAELSRVCAELRKLSLKKSPSISETIDWGKTLLLLGKSALDRETAEATLGAIVKYDEDRRTVIEKLPKLIP